jgi:hypothetical protein
MSIAGLDAWLQSPQGRYVMAWEQAGSTPWLPTFSATTRSSSACRNSTCCCRTASPCARWPAIRARSTSLRSAATAFRRAQHRPGGHGACLEFHDDPHQILREVERVLIPEGEVIITGFNPLSLWGLRRRLPNCPATSPGTATTCRCRASRTGCNCSASRSSAASFGCYAPPCIINAGSSAGISWKPPAIAGGPLPAASTCCARSSACMACA